MTPPGGRGFGRLIEAGKGVGKIFEYLAREDAKQVAECAARELEPHKPVVPCARDQVPGWRCVVDGEHVECVLKRDP